MEHDRTHTQAYRFRFVVLAQRSWIKLDTTNRFHKEPCSSFPTVKPGCLNIADGNDQAPNCVVADAFYNLLGSLALRCVLWCSLLGALFFHRQAKG